MSSYPPPVYGPPPGAYGPMRTTNGKAIAALICGIAGFVFCPLTSIAAVILGSQAKREIAGQPHRYDGEGLAKAGQILGWIGIGLMIVGALIAAVLIVVAAIAGTTSSYSSLAALTS